MKKYQTLLLQKYLNNDLSTSELEIFFKHLEELDPNEAEEVCRQRWVKEEKMLNEQSRKSIKEGVLGKISPASEPMVRPIYKRRIWLSPVLKIAASVTLLLSIVVWTSRNDSDRSNPIEVVTASGQQVEWTLPDETKVTLNENSTLRYSSDFSAVSVREVYLVGEAYFEVKKEEDRKRHFKVITDGLAVDVLGTVFNVNTATDATEVYLEEGSVRLTFAEEHEDRQILMQPGDLVKYSSAQKRVVKHVANQSDIIGRWQDNIMFFNKVPMNEVLQALSSQYQLSLIIEDESVLERTIIAGLPKDNLDQAMRAIEKILDVDLVLQEDQLRIK